MRYFFACFCKGDRVWAFIHYRWFEGVVERVRYGWYTVRVPELNREINLRRSVLYPADFAPFQYSIGWSSCIDIKKQLFCNLRVFYIILCER